jgi:hypothetical protein
LVSPGWEFKLEFTFDVRSSIRRQKKLAEEEEAAEKADKDAKEPDVAVEELSKVSYVATYLAPDSDGDYQRRNTKRLNDKTIFTKVSDVQIPKSVIEEHREVYCSNKYATDPEDDMFDTISSPVLYIHSPILLMPSMLSLIANHVQTGSLELNIVSRESKVISDRVG